MKYCSNCGRALRDDAIFCDACGTPASSGGDNRDQNAGQSSGYDPFAQTRSEPGENAWQSAGWQSPNGAPNAVKADSLATASLILGVLSFFSCPLVLGIVSIVLASRSALYSGGVSLPYAKAGRICGILGMIFGVGVRLLYWILSVAGIVTRGFFWFL